MNDPFNELTTHAIHLHEVFASFIEAGFTRQESLYLVGQMLHGTTQGQSGS